MNDVRSLIVYTVGAIISLLSPIHTFMHAMLVLFGVNFIIGLFAARMTGEKWDTKKALMFFVYVLVFLLIACTAFVVGRLMGEQEQAVAVVKLLCFLAVYIFGTNIFRNLRFIAPKGSAWYKLFDLCYFVLSVKFIERFEYVKKWREENQ